MSSSSSSDEEDERLKDALDPTLMTQDLYSTKQPSSDKVEKVKDVTAHVKVEETKSEVQKSSQKSLRRDKNKDDIDDSRNVTPHLKVTPQFQNYIAKQLDIIIGNSLLETPLEKSAEQTSNGQEQEFVIKLLKRSAKPVDLTEVPEIKLKRPNLLKHRSIPDAQDLSSEELSSIAVTTEQVLAKTGTEYYANRFASRVEEGITKTKKKHKWKRKKKAGMNEAEKDTEIKGDSKPVNGDVNDVEGSTKKKKKKKKKKKNDEETTVNGDVKNNSAKVENGSESNNINENDVNNPTKKKKKKKKNGDE